MSESEESSGAPNDESAESADQPTVKRRGFVAVSVAAVAGALVGAGATWGGTAIVRSREEDDPGSDDKGKDDDRSEDAVEIRRFVSTALTVPAVTAWSAGAVDPSPGYYFLSPRDKVFTAAIFDNAGEPVWISDAGVDTADFRVQKYRGKPVLTYWTGRVDSGNGQGAGVILDTAYREIARVPGGNGMMADLHEFHLTSDGTALLTTYPAQKIDLSSVGGPKDGWAFACRIQEIDIETGEVLLDWNMLDDLDIAESYKTIDKDDAKTGRTPESAFDPVHVNSADEDGDRIIISARHMCALYVIDRRSGELVWRIGGKKSDFAVADDAAFSWQHDARWREEGTISLFDNNGVSGDRGVSSGLILSLDEEAMEVRLKTALRYGEYEGYAMGNTQLLDDGHAIVGWGSAPAVTEFDETNTAICGLTDVGAGSYRAYRLPWSGKPTTQPDAAVQDSAAGTPTLYVSWNGATAVASWTIFTGMSDRSLVEGKTVERNGFETPIPIPAGSTVVQAEARDDSGAALGRTRIIALE